MIEVHDGCPQCVYPLVRPWRTVVRTNPDGDGTVRGRSDYRCPNCRHEWYTERLMPVPEWR